MCKLIAYASTSFLLFFLFLITYVHISEWLYSQIILLFLGFYKFQVWIKKMMVLQVLDVSLALFFCTTGIVGLVIAIARNTARCDSIAPLCNEVAKQSNEVGLGSRARFAIAAMIIDEENNRLY